MAERLVPIFLAVVGVGQAVQVLLLQQQEQAVLVALQEQVLLLVEMGVMAQP
jgi:hypothetical protein